MSLNEKVLSNVQLSSNKVTFSHSHPRKSKQSSDCKPSHGYMHLSLKSNVSKVLENKLEVCQTSFLSFNTYKMDQDFKDLFLFLSPL